MKSVVLIACLILSSNAAPEPQKSAGLERESSPKKSDKLQFEPADAQLYTGSVVSRNPIAPQQVVVPQTVVADQVIPSYYGQGSVIPGVGQVYRGVNQVVPAGVSQVVPAGVNQLYSAGVNQIYPAGVNQVYPAGVNQVYSAGVVPYSSVGQTTVTTTSQNGLPVGTVYEHHGREHVGHQANAVHIRRPGQLYAAASPAVIGVVPSAYVPSNVVGQYNGQVQWINGQQAQYIDGQWYYVKEAVRYPGLGGIQYANPLNRPTIIGQSPAVYNVPSKTWNSVGQPLVGTQWATAPAQWGAGPAQWDARPTVVGVRPQGEANKWYTKTNTQQAATPFYRQPAYASTNQYASKSPAGAAAVPRPAQTEAEAEKSDW